jgi:hypothetical protein
VTLQVDHRIPDGPVRRQDLPPDGPRRGPARLRLSPDRQLELLAEAIVELADQLANSAAAPAAGAKGKRTPAAPPAPETPALDAIRRMVDFRRTERDGGLG